VPRAHGRRRHRTLDAAARDVGDLSIDCSRWAATPDNPQTGWESLHAEHGREVSRRPGEAVVTGTRRAR
jgi:hypothetical protein